MKIEIIDKEGSIIKTLNLECNPFKLGETLYLKIKSKDGQSFYDSFSIVKIEHYIKEENVGNNDVIVSYTTSIVVM